MLVGSNLSPFNFLDSSNHRRCAGSRRIWIGLLLRVDLLLWIIIRRGRLLRLNRGKLWWRCEYHLRSGSDRFKSCQTFFKNTNCISKTTCHTAISDRRTQNHCQQRRKRCDLKSFHSSQLFQKRGVGSSQKNGWKE